MLGIKVCTTMLGLLRKIYIKKFGLELNDGNLACMETLSLIFNTTQKQTNRKQKEVLNTWTRKAMTKQKKNFFN